MRTTEKNQSRRMAAYELLFLLKLLIHKFDFGAGLIFRIVIVWGIHKQGTKYDCQINKDIDQPALIILEPVN